MDFTTGCFEGDLCKRARCESSQAAYVMYDFGYLSFFLSFSSLYLCWRRNPQRYIKITYLPTLHTHIPSQQVYIKKILPINTIPYVQPTRTKPYLIHSHPTALRNALTNPIQSNPSPSIRTRPLVFKFLIPNRARIEFVYPVFD